MQKYIDSHCHLPASGFFADSFSDANAVGVNKCVLNSVTPDDWSVVADIAHTNKNVSGCIGIHPYYTDSVPQNWANDMIDLLRLNPNLMLGEVGLDKTHDNFVAQEKIFIRELEIAIEYNRVINLHCVHAWDVLLQILKSYKTKLPKIVVHSFDGTQNAIDFGTDLYFSYSPNIIKPNYKKIQTTICNVPKNKILTESDNTNITDVLLATNGVLSLRHDITADDIYNNAMGVFFNG